MFEFSEIIAFARIYVYRVCVKSCSHASAMECDTFGCVIKSRVTRALYIIHAATPLTALTRILAPVLFFYSFVGVYQHPLAERASFFFLRVILSFFPPRRIPHSGGFIFRGRSAPLRKHPRTLRRITRGRAISSARQDLLAQYLSPPSRTVHSRNCSPSSVIKLNFPAACGLGCELSFNLPMVAGLQ